MLDARREEEPGKTVPSRTVAISWGATTNGEVRACARSLRCEGEDEDVRDVVRLVDGTEEKDEAEDAEKEMIRALLSGRAGGGEDVILVDWLTERVARLLIITYRRNLYFVTFDDEGDCVSPVPSMSKVWIPLESLWAEVEWNTYPEPRSHSREQLCMDESSSEVLPKQQGYDPSPSTRVPSLKISAYSPNRSPPCPSPTPSLSSFTENPTTPPALFSFTESCKKDRVFEGEITDHESAFAYFVRFLEKHKCFDKVNVKHSYPSMHNGHALVGIEECLKILSDADSIAFLTQCSIRRSWTASPSTVADPKGLRKYRFYSRHNLNLASPDLYTLRAVGTQLRNPIEKTTLIVMHPDTGAVDSSMDLILLDSHPGEDILNRQAGWAALTGTSDFSIIGAHSSPDNECETLAFNLVVDRRL
ncbi:hypothetical protein DFH11DRAFT_1834183 [Phellopilus nigrolimitatus]|nr:hypothetical protein DFH11DRAFT_1834183 [Phellopilus nigrolimitatus]